MKVDGIERETIIINPYRHTEADNTQTIIYANQKDIIKTENDDNLSGTNKNQKITVSQQELNKMMEELRHKFSMLEKYLQIDIDQELQMPISKIIDMTTEEVIRQIPPEWIVEILRRMEELKGVFYSREV
ncbi:flagellar protein FlaG [Thermodesulfovibrio sp. 3462-1]|uniref:Flagellar protein FlaG n=1 Tax=Thermodesulfovibrio obliviosus TaxID=3118332 RepID=A0AAU8H349_9BACT